jgi:hypothetical protein
VERLARFQRDGQHVLSRQLNCQSLIDPSITQNLERTLVQLSMLFVPSMMHAVAASDNSDPRGTMDRPGAFARAKRCAGNM